MNRCFRLLPWLFGFVVSFSGLLAAGEQKASPDSPRLDRLVGLAKLWAAVNYFHPYLVYREELDWDAALIRALPKVNAARNSAEYSAAIQSLLGELGDPVTRVVPFSEPGSLLSRPGPERQPTFETDRARVLVVRMTHYADFQDFVGTTEKLAALKKALPDARAVLIDLRPDLPPSEFDQGLASYSLAESGLAEALVSGALALPGERRRIYQGYAPQDGTTSGDYSSGFYLQGRQPIRPAPGGKGLPVVFLISSDSDLPEVALALQDSGKGAVVCEGDFSEAGAVSTQTVELPDGVRAQIRLGELIYPDGTGGFAPNLTVPGSAVKSDQNPAFQAALRLAMDGKFSPPTRRKIPQRGSAPLDRAYLEMTYPPAEYRELAAIRFWAVINYFFPYKELVGEEWDEILRQFLPRMESAKDALEYNLVAAEMVTHLHDSHGSTRSPLLSDYFGQASTPFRVRSIEGLPVITGFTDSRAAAQAGLEIGDVILKVDGTEAGARIAERLKYTPASTPQSAMYYATERALVRGPKDSIATLTIRDLHDQVREVKVARSIDYLPATQGDRTGPVLQLLPGQIGYADLDRLTGAQVDEMFDKFKDCPAIILDDRGYPQGTAWQIAPRLAKGSGTAAALFKRRNPATPDLPSGELLSSEEFTTFYQRLPHTDKPRYQGQTVLLIDERTISQAEHTGLFFEAANGTKFIGSPTQGANGDVTNLILPGGIKVSFTGQGVSHADGRQLQRVGLKPDIEIRPTLAGIRAGRDEVLDRAVRYLQQDRPE